MYFKYKMNSHFAHEVFYYAQYGETAVEPIYYRVAALGPESFHGCTIIICDYFDRF